MPPAPIFNTNIYDMSRGFRPEGERRRRLSQTLERSLGSRAHYYKNALICESQSYGIGALAYYRRIVEEIIEDLLDDIPALMAGEERDEYLEALEQAKKTTITQKKIDLEAAPIGE